MSKLVDYNDIKKLHDRIDRVDVMLDNRSRANTIKLDDIDIRMQTIENGGITPEFVKINEMTYSDLFTLYKTKSLKPGAYYAITDYDCCYIHPSGGNDTVFELKQSADDVEKIILLAIDYDKFDYNVHYIRKDGYAKIMECKYTIDPNEIPFTSNMTVYKPKGAVFYMKDEYENECSYDFKHVKFRRYAIKDIKPNTDPNDGTGGFAGPYKFAATDTAYKFSDTRAMIGSGDAWDATFIPALFKGKWGDLLSYTSGMKPYHDDFILENYKPYQNTNYPWDKYLSWQTNMCEKGGISEPTDWKTCKVYGQTVVEVDANDYKDRYTFDYNGQDASEMMMASSAQPLIRNTSVTNSYCGHKLPASEILPNTVIAISDRCKNGAATRIQTTRIISDTGVAGVRNNTILLVGLPGLDYGYLTTCNFLDGKTNYGFSSNLMIVGGLIDVNWHGTMRNFVCGAMQCWDILDSITGNVIFGYYSNLKGFDLNSSVFYGAHNNVKYEGETSYHSPEDGSYWYDTVWRDWFAYNIIGPNQYSSFKPHFNTNTVRSAYNKGVDWGPTNQGSSYGRCVWGTNIGYGSTQGGIKFNDLVRVNVEPSAFKSVAITNSTGQELFNNDQNPVPPMYNCDVRSFLGNPSTISTDLTETQLTRLKSNSGSSRSVLTVLNGKWTLLEQDGTVIP